METVVSYMFQFNVDTVDIWYVASTSGPKPSLFKLCVWGQKWAGPGGHMFYIG